MNNILYTNINTIIGNVILISKATFLIGLYPIKHKSIPNLSTFLEDRKSSLFISIKEQLDEYLNGNITTFDIQYKLHGSTLQNFVWNNLAQIPYGYTTTYKHIANIASVNPRYAARIISQNPISIIVACHRVIGSNGNLMGYASGIEIKQELLKIENLYSKK